MGVLDQLWEKAEGDENRMFRYLMLLDDMQPALFKEALKELIHIYAESKKR